MTPQDIAVTRRLLALAKAGGWSHVMTGVEWGSEFSGWEHRWQSAEKECEVRLWQLGLVVEADLGTYIDSRPIESAQQVADLLAAVGLVPVEFTSGWIQHDSAVRRLDWGVLMGVRA